MRNNAHMENSLSRLARFENNPPVEVIDTLLNSIDNHLNNEIKETINTEPPQTSLLFLGIHSVALTISEGLYGKKGIEGYKFFLERFVDGTEPDTQFSHIAESIHDWRNVLAHQWLGNIGHSIGYDYDMDLGWEIRDDVCFINPRIYCEHYLSAFTAGGRIWLYEEDMTNKEQEKAKGRLIQKYKGR